MDAVPTVTVPISDTATVWITAGNVDVGQSLVDISAVVADILHIVVLFLGLMLWKLLRSL